MKRRIKLLTSIASLAIAMSFLAFGVYASATARLINLSGSVSFTVDNVAAQIDIANIGLTNVAAPTTGTFTTFRTYNLNDNEGVQVGYDNTEFAIGTIKFTESQTYLHILVKITSKFTGANGRKIQIIPPTVVHPDNPNITMSVTVIGTNPLVETNKLPAAGVITYRISYALDANISPNVGTKTIAPRFELSAV